MKHYSLNHGNASEKEKVAVTITLKLGDELLEAIDNAAGQLPRNHWLAQILAVHFGRPGLAEIPHKTMGRPRGKLKPPDGHPKRRTG